MPRVSWVWLLAALLLPPAAQASQRVALVIGNAAYQHTARLANPGNDAADVSAALRAAGFSVQTLTDAGKSRMEQALSGFAGKAAGSEMAVLFFAGHGMELNGQNYLIPVDAKLETAPTPQASITAQSPLLTSTRCIAHTAGWKTFYRPGS